MLFFRSEEHINRWYGSEAPPGATLTLRQQWELAKIWYSDRMDPEWIRRSPEQAQAVFTSLGLTGDFWKLQP